MSLSTHSNHSPNLSNIATTLNITDVIGQQSTNLEDAQWDRVAISRKEYSEMADLKGNNESPDLEEHDEHAKPENEAEDAEHCGYAKKAADWARTHPFKAASMGIGGLLVLAPGAVVAPVLGVVGFGAGGIVGGTSIPLFWLRANI